MGSIQLVRTTLLGLLADIHIPEPFDPNHPDRDPIYLDNEARQRLTERSRIWLTRDKTALQPS